MPFSFAVLLLGVICWTGLLGKLLLSKVVLTLKMYLHDPMHHFIILLFRISGSDDQLKVVYLVIKDTKDITCVKTLLN